MGGAIWDYFRRGDVPPRWRWACTHRVVIGKEWRGALRRLGHDSVAGVVTSTLGRVVSWDRKLEKNDVKRLEAEAEAGGSGRVLFVKRYFNYMFEKIWKRAFRGSWWPPSMVKREYDNLGRLAGWGFLVPEPVAYGEQRFAGALINAFLITAEIPKAMGLDYLLHEWLPLQPEGVRRRCRVELLEHLAGMLRRLHELRFEHHDLFLRNLMVSDLDFTRIYLLDAPRGRQWPRWWFGRGWVIHDLAALDAAAPSVFRRTERLRFYLRYRNRRRLGEGDKSTIRRILRCATPWRGRQTMRLRDSFHISPPGRL